MYANWNLRSELSFRHIKWFDVNDILECAQFYRKRLFASGDGVIIQDFYLRHISPKAVPFAPDKRFPPNKLYISHGFGDWEKIENMEDVFDQDKFEKTFKLKWEERIKGSVSA
ncbi:hypothetical protein BJV82DRAFT_573166 [Fennellomyces sp. T-0311]|nr:hypothetical protein BJV82DRAFT_573166 [Fennellomyces sp. T-0311]